MMKIKIGMFEFDGSPEDFDQIVKSGALKKCLGPTKIGPEKKIGNEDLWKDLERIGEKHKDSFVALYGCQISPPWPKIDPAELGIDTLQAKEAFVLQEDQRQTTDDN